MFGEFSFFFNECFWPGGLSAWSRTSACRISIERWRFDKARQWQVARQNLGAVLLKLRQHRSKSAQLGPTALSYHCNARDTGM